MGYMIHSLGIGQCVRSITFLRKGRPIKAHKKGNRRRSRLKWAVERSMEYRLETSNTDWRATMNTMEVRFLERHPNRFRKLWRRLQKRSSKVDYSRAGWAWKSHGHCGMRWSRRLIGQMRRGIL